MPGAPAYPPSRERVPPSAAHTSELFGRIESTNGERELADTNAVLITFSGTPDVIRIVSRAFGAIVTLTDRLNRDDAVFSIMPYEELKIRAKRERVIARNLTPGSNAFVTVTGLWAEEDEAGSGR